MLQLAPGAVARLRLRRCVLDACFLQLGTAKVR